MAFSFNNIPIGNTFKAKRANFGVGSFIFLLIFGIIFIGVSWLFVADDFRSSKWPSIDGTVTNVTRSTDSDGDVSYRPTVSYTIDGNTYTTARSYSSSQSYSVGTPQAVRYNPDNPSDAVIGTHGSGFFVYLFPLVGLGIIILAIVLFIRNIRRTGQINSLKQTGVKLQGIVTGIGSNGSTNNGTAQIIVSATGPDGQVHHYKSDAINGLNIMGIADYQTKPVAIDVYINPTNPELYYVDLDDIPDITPERITELLSNVASQNNPIATPPTVKNVPPMPQPPANPTFLQK